MAGVTDVVRLPGQLIGGVASLFRGAPAQSPAAVGQQASTDEKDIQAARDALEDRNIRLNAVRRCALALSHSECPDPEMMSLLKPGLQAYLKGLTPAECNLIAHSAFDARVRLFVEGIPPRGVRTAGELSSLHSTPKPAYEIERPSYSRAANDDADLSRAAALLA